MVAIRPSRRVALPLPRRDQERIMAERSKAGAPDATLEHHSFRGIDVAGPTQGAVIILGLV